MARNRTATPTFEEPTTMFDTDETYAVTEAEVEGTVALEETPAELPQETAEQAKRAPRKPIDVGTVQVRKSSRTDFSTRPTRLDSNPVFLAVKGAEKGEPYDLVVEAGKEAGVISILRRAGQKLEIGVNIASAPYPVATDEETGEEIVGHVVLSFRTADRDTRKGKGGEGANVTETPAEVADVASE